MLIKATSARMRWHKTTKKVYNHGLNHAAPHTNAIIANDAWILERDGQLQHRTYHRGEPDGKALFTQMTNLSTAIRASQNRDYKAKHGRKLRSDANHFVELLVTFSRAVDTDEAVDEMNACALNLAQQFAEKHGIKLISVCRHNDEAKGHFHICYSAYSFDLHKPITQEIGKKELQELQTMAGNAFSPLGIQRGTPKAEKLKKSIENNPKQDNETDAEYMLRLFKLANIRNKSVAELHATLEADIAALELQAKALQMKQQTAKMVCNIERETLAKLDKEIESLNAIISAQETQLTTQREKSARTDQSQKQLSQQDGKKRLVMETLKQQERELHRKEIDELHEELSASEPYLNDAINTLDHAVEAEAPYLKQKPENRQKMDKAKVEHFKAATKAVTDTPIIVFNLLRFPKNIKRWTELKLVKAIFDEGMRRSREWTPPAPGRFKRTDKIKAHAPH